MKRFFLSTTFECRAVNRYLGAVLFLMVVLGCGEPQPKPDRVCDPGALQRCPCLGDVPQGIQVCLDDASGWGECECVGGSTDGDSDTDGDGDGDGDGDSDADGDTDADADTDVDTDADGDTDTGTSPVTDTDSGTDGDTTTGQSMDSGVPDSGSEQDTETQGENPWIPPGCEIVSSYAEEFSGKYSFYGDIMVWAEAFPTCKVAMARRLSTKEEIILTDCRPMAKLKIWKDMATWDQSDGTGYHLTRELYRVNIDTKEIERLTENECGDYAALPGENYLVYLNECVTGTVYLSYMDLATRESYQITSHSQSLTPGYDFDGERWIVWVYNDVGYKYDLLNQRGPTVLDSSLDLVTWPKITDGKVYSGSWTSPVDPSRACDVHIHDLETGENQWAFEQPYDQILPSASGHVLAYLDTKDQEQGWFIDSISNIELFDLDTKVIRRVTNLPSLYYALGLHGKYMAWAGGESTLFLCDLEAGGFIDAEGHVIPEGAEADAGPDGGAAPKSR